VETAIGSSNLDFGVKTAAVYREQILFPVLYALPERPEDRAARGVDVPDREPTSGGSSTPGLRRVHRLSTSILDRMGTITRALRRRPDRRSSINTPVIPLRPVPYVGYVADGMTRDYMTEDQRFAAQRPDVLVYQTEPLETDLTDRRTDPGQPQRLDRPGPTPTFVVKLIDVYPGNYPGVRGHCRGSPCQSTRSGWAAYQQLVRGEPFRAKFRRSFEQAGADGAGPANPDRV
jgi:hypothetical protein